MDVENKKTILIVDDDQALNRAVVKFLKKNGLHAEAETDGENALNRVHSATPGMIILDVMLPGRDGLSICRELRAQYAGPILMLTALADDIDKVAGLETGADNYIAKPVPPRVLLAHIRALLRRHNQVPELAVKPKSRVDYAQAARQDTVVVGDLVLKAGARSATLNGDVVSITSAEFDLLWLLANHAGRVLSRETLCINLCGRPHDALDRTIDLRISRLRKKLGDDPQHPARIKSIRGVGYILTS